MPVVRGGAGPRWSPTSIVTAGWLPVVGSLLAILGVRVLLVGVAGNPTPYWDQWDGEALNPIDPWVNGTLRFADLLAAHNEHRIFFTRLTSLLVLEVAGNWNPLAEMLVNATIIMAALVVLAIGLRKIDLGGRYGPLALAAFMIFGVPITAENILWGFQSQFYFLVLFAVVAVCLTATARAFSPRWLCGALVAAASFLTLASGGLTPLAIAVLMGVQMLAGDRARGPREGLGIALLATLTVAYIAATPVIPYHAGLRASSVSQFVMAFSRTAGWPIFVPILGPVILNLPAGILLARLYRARTSIADPRWRIVGIALWAGLQAASIAYGRGGWPISSRYLDILSLLVFANVIALFTLPASIPRDRMFAADLWVVMVTGFFVMNCIRIIPGQPSLNLAFVRAQAANVRAYVLTGDRTVLSRPRFILPAWRPARDALNDTSVPYPHADKLADIIDRPVVRGVLPEMFGSSAVERERVRQRLLLKGGLAIPPNTVAIFGRWTGGLLLALGLSMMMVFATASSRREPE